VGCKFWVWEASTNVPLSPSVTCESEISRFGGTAGTGLEWGLLSRNGAGLWGQ
jgi:hypothetical protein